MRKRKNNLSFSTSINPRRPQSFKKLFSAKTRPLTAAIVGIALGDEGKGRIVDNKIQTFLNNKKVKKVAIVRFQGGNNAGHTVEKDNIKLALHLIPSGVLYKETINIVDRGVVVHPEDLVTEINYVEENAGKLDNNLFLSEEAILCTDLERAEESLNRMKSPAAKGGTGRGIGPAYAHHYDRLGLKLYHLLAKDWESTLFEKYKLYKKIFSTFGLKLEETVVPDYLQTLENKKAASREVGKEEVFLERLKKAREVILKRKLFRNTFPLHESIYKSRDTAVIFEGAQAAGLDAWLGTYPDVTSSNTSAFGIREGTGFWLPEDIEKIYGVFKIPYTSSVGSRIMPTHINTPNASGKKRMTKDQAWATWVREDAHEYGTTTGRPRDINFLDLPMLSYNIRMSGVNMLIGTHLDTANPTDKIKVCSQYLDKRGKRKSYQPGLRNLTGVKPKYVELSGWDGKECREVKNKKDLPENAKRFLGFLEDKLGYPIVAVTTGPSRENFISFRKS